ncbi:MAG: hypothetical protein EOP83_19430, partial [Verrucomicrobiaceae bacterium]
DTLEHGPELWTTNGTPKTTRLLKELIPGPVGISIFSPTTFGPADAIKTAFTYRDPIAGKDVWVTDGTEAGTLRVYQPPANRNTYTNFGTTRGFFFTELTLTEWPHEDPRYEKVLFSDGTPAGTRDLSPITGSLIHSAVYFVDGPWAYLTVDYNEIWRSDGTAAGTTKLVTSPYPGGNGVVPMGIIGGRLLVTFYRPGQSTELWTSSPDGGDLTRVTSSPVDHQWYPSAVTRIGERIFFPGANDYGHLELWVTDGTAAGTRQIELPFEEGKYGSYPVTVVPWRDSIYISTSESGAYDYSTRLFRANADLTEITRLGTFPHGVQLFPAADWREDEPYFYFQATTSSYDDWKLWRTKGDVASTKLAKEVPATHYLRAGMESLANTPAGKIYAVADREFGPWNASSPLYRQRGKHGSAQRLTKPEKWNASGVASFYYGDGPLHETTGKYLLEFVDTGRDQELWRMNPDGTGARALWSPPKPIDPSNGSLSFRSTTSGGAIFLYREYNYEDSSSTSQLWTSDGTRPGTRLLHDYSEHTEEGASLPANFVQVGDTLFYTVYGDDDAPNDRDYLWKTDGTPNGTTRVLAEGGSMLHVAPGEMVSFQGALYFLTWDSDYDSMLWRTDGTEEGTTYISHFYQKRSYGYAHGLSVVGGKLLCFADPAGSYKLWQSDGTEEGTEAIVSPVGFWGSDLRPIDLGNRVIFRGKEAFENSAMPCKCTSDIKLVHLILLLSLLCSPHKHYKESFHVTV